MKKVITYGTYDLLHKGHINLLRRAKALGDYLIVGVTTDNFDYERGKLNVRNNVMERVKAVQSTGLADEVIIEEYLGQKIDDIQKYGIDIFAIGNDWVGKFDYIKEYCKVVYLPRTEGISSTILRAKSDQVIRLGIIGTGNIASRMCDEVQYVSRCLLSCVFNPIIEEQNLKKFAKEHNIPKYTHDFSKFLDCIDAAYIATPHTSHYEYAKDLIQNGKHVLNETPFVLNKQSAEEIFKLALKSHILLMDAIKTAYCPAFCHLITLIKSGIIGDIIDVEASLTVISNDERKFNPIMKGGSMSEDGDSVILPIFELLGTNYNNIIFYSRYENGVDIYTKGIMTYPHATASFKVGLGVKTEGNLVITGTHGYVYVPAPWWKTSYFEVRYERSE